MSAARGSGVPPLPLLHIFTQSGGQGTWRILKVLQTRFHQRMSWSLTKVWVQLKRKPLMPSTKIHWTSSLKRKFKCLFQLQPNQVRIHGPICSVWICSVSFKLLSLSHWNMWIKELNMCQKEVWFWETRVLLRKYHVEMTFTCSNNLFWRVYSNESIRCAEAPL